MKRETLEKVFHYYIYKIIKYNDCNSLFQSFILRKLFERII
jgi:hypothetical protein